MHSTTRHVLLDANVPYHVTPKDVQCHSETTYSIEESNTKDPLTPAAHHPSTLLSQGHLLPVGGEARTHTHPASVLGGITASDFWVEVEAEIHST